MRHLRGLDLLFTIMVYSILLLAAMAIFPLFYVLGFFLDGIRVFDARFLRDTQAVHPGWLLVFTVASRVYLRLPQCGYH